MWDGKAVASGCIQDVLSGHWFGPLHGPHFCPVQRSGVWSLGRAKHFFSRTGGILVSVVLWASWHAACFLVDCEL